MWRADNWHASAYDLGFKAGQNGEPKEPHPFPYILEKKMDWDRGWKDGQLSMKPGSEKGATTQDVA